MDTLGIPMKKNKTDQLKLWSKSILDSKAAIFKKEKKERSEGFGVNLELHQTKKD